MARYDLIDARGLLHRSVANLNRVSDIINDNLASEGEDRKRIFGLIQRIVRHLYLLSQELEDMQLDAENAEGVEGAECECE